MPLVAAPTPSPSHKAGPGQKQTFEIVTKSEFAILILWVILPPLLVGSTLMWRLQRGVRPQIAFVLLSLVLTVALLLFGPNWLGRYRGLQDVEFLGRRMMWSPLGWVCATTAWPVAALLSLHKKRMPRWVAQHFLAWKRWKNSARNGLQ